MSKQLGRYELRRAIGRGAAGTVWEGWDTTLTRRVAIKVVRPGNSDDFEIEELLTRFRQEAQVASCLSHVGVVQVHDYGEADGEAYIVMEFVDGDTLKALLDRSGRLTPSRAGELMNGVLLALEHCHRQSIVHRDIKPGNIMLPAAGGVKLADFGIARTENSELTMIGTMMGTPPYMSPEQFTAREPIDWRSDIWSCGVMFYEMLTGDRPFPSGSVAAIGQAVVNDPVEPPSRRAPGLPPALDQVVLQALRKKPAERFASAQAFAEAIQAALLASQPAPADQGRRPRVVLAASGISLALLAAGGGAWLWYNPQNPVPVPLVAPAAPVAPPIGASPAAPMQVVPPRSIPAQIAALPCSTVTVLSSGPNTVTSFRGIIGSGAPRETLDGIIARLKPAEVKMSVQTFEPTELSCRLAEMVRANAGAIAARLSTVDGRTRLVTGEDIRLQLAMPDFDGEVRLEDLDSDGRISNMMEGNFGSLPRHRAGTQVGLGRNGDTLIGRVAAPYGTDILLAIVSSEPLFATPRPPEESGAQFISDLEAAMAAVRRRGGEVAADALALTTAQK